MMLPLVHKLIDSSPPDPAIRADWLNAAIRGLQLAAGEAALLDATDARTFFAEVARKIPAAANASERVVLRGVLFEFASRGGAALHARLHVADQGTCPVVAAAYLETFFANRATSPQAALADWAQAFFGELARVHPPMLASQVARAIRLRYREPLTTAALARQFDTTPARLRLAFQRHFGTSTGAYQRAVRIFRALGQVRTDKVDAVALAVGYKSKKNFYRAFRQLTGMTPSQLRQLSNTNPVCLRMCAAFRHVCDGRHCG